MAGCDEWHQSIVREDDFLSMSAAELKAIRKVLRMSQAEWGTAPGASMRAVQNWEGGLRAIPGPVAVLSRLLLKIYHSGIEYVN